MNAIRVPPATTLESNPHATLKKLGIGVLIAFTVKGILTGSFLIYMLWGLVGF